MTKQKTRKELEEDRENYLTFAIIFFVGMVVLGVLFLSFAKTSIELKTQLSECQEQVPVCIKKNDYWTFEVKCDYGDFLQEHTIYRYGNYNDCKYFINFWLNNKKIKNCKVIE